MIYNIANSYSAMTGLRHCKISEFSGEDFYHKQLNELFKEACEKNEVLTIDLDGSLGGYAPSFLDEAFGNLVYDFGLDLVKRWLEIKSEQGNQWLELIHKGTFPDWEKRRKENKPPTYTEEHPARYVFVDEKMKQKKLP